MSSVLSASSVSSVSSSSSSSSLSSNCSSSCFLDCCMEFSDVVVPSVKPVIIINPSLYTPAASRHEISSPPPVLVSPSEESFNISDNTLAMCTVHPSPSITPSISIRPSTPSITPSISHSHLRPPTPTPIPIHIDYCSSTGHIPIEQEEEDYDLSSIIAPPPTPTGSPIKMGPLYMRGRRSCSVDVRQKRNSNKSKDKEHSSGFIFDWRISAP